MADSIPGNSTSTTALPVGDSLQSAVDHPGDVDWWRVFLYTGFGYQIWVEGMGSGMGSLADPYLALYDGSGAFQYAVDDIVPDVNRDAYTNAVPLSDGVYFIAAQAYGAADTGSYTITLWRDELASTASAASLAVTGRSLLGHLGWQGDDADWYRITLTAGVQYQFDLIGSAGDGEVVENLTLEDPWLTLRDASGALLLTDDDSGLGNNARLYFTPDTSGIYYLDAQEYGNDTFGTYRLIANADPVLDPLAIGSALQSAVDFEGDADLFAVSLNANITYRFEAGGGTLADPFLELIDAEGATVGSDDDSGDGLDARLDFRPATSGTYFVAVRASGNDSTGTFTVRASQPLMLSVADAQVTEGTTGTRDLVFPLSLSAPSASPVSVELATSGSSTATAGTDYLARATVVNFAPGQTQAEFRVPVVGDTVFEPTESLLVQLSAVQGALLAQDEARGYIVDDDSPYPLPSDPLLPLQWYLYPGTGIQVFPVWQDYTGAGVQVAVFDQGIDSQHPDLDGNLLTGAGRSALNLSAGGPPVQADDNHGTAVAGALAAERNGTGIVGVAPDADLVSIYSPLQIDGLAGEIANAYAYALNVDVLNDSWGFANGFASGATWAFYDDFQGAFAAAGQALTQLASQGRGGLGTVVVQSAGNSFELGDDTNLHNFQNSPYIITVAATDYAGNVTAYSSPGASVLVAAPGGGGDDPLSNILTTDRVGAAGYAAGDYNDIAGTSFSAPIVSGIVALMLQANPHLGYRDVQEILALSARQVGTALNVWEYNGADHWNGGGLHYDALDHNLGFGLVDARAAVRLAETWSEGAHTFANRQQVTATRSPALAIPDNTDQGAYDTITVTQSIEVERAEVTLHVTHPFIGDLSVLLTSPSGTTSFLLWRPQQNPLSAFGSDRNDIHFTFNTVLGWGEESAGVWQIAVYDDATDDVGQLDSWTLNLIGKPHSDDDVYYYTDEFAESCAVQPERALLSDSGGADTLNAAACSARIDLDLSGQRPSTIDGHAWAFAAGTLIEHAIGGDGNDSIDGNAAANHLRGMRGADQLSGQAGQDTLEGGDGSDQIDGGTGIDIAVFEANRAAYQLSRSTPAGAIHVTESASGDTDHLLAVERLQFTDRRLAMDLALGENAADVAQFLGTVAFGLQNDPGLFGTILGIADGGLDLAGLFGLASDLGLIRALAGGSGGPADVARLAFRNIVGFEPDAAMTDLLASFMDGRSASLTQTQFLTTVANLDLNLAHIGLVGLQAQGIEYV